jgi:hypothetical protein
MDGPVEIDPPGPAAAPAAAPPLPANALLFWQRAGESLAGLAADFAALAASARWKDELLEVVLPATASSAASFLRQPEVAAGVSRALAEIAGRPVRHGIVVGEPAAREPGRDAAATAAVADRPRPAASQAALLREAIEHPLVVHARTLFDAAVRKVEPARPRPAAQAVAVAARAAGADDERDHSVEDVAAEEGGDPASELAREHGGGDG